MPEEFLRLASFAFFHTTKRNFISGARCFIFRLDFRCYWVSQFDYLWSIESRDTRYEHARRIVPCVGIARVFSIRLKAACRLLLRFVANYIRKAWSTSDDGEDDSAERLVRQAMPIVLRRGLPEKFEAQNAKRRKKNANDEKIPSQCRSPRNFFSHSLRLFVLATRTNCVMNDSHDELIPSISCTCPITFDEFPITYRGFAGLKSVRKHFCERKVKLVAPSDELNGGSCKARP